MATFEYQCNPCKLIFEECRPIADRYIPAKCPECGQDSKKIMSRVNFNEIFPGSTKRESLAEHWTKESIKAQEEGFRSQDELDTAIGMAKERAKQMGQPDKQLIGPVQSPFKGGKYNPSADEVQVADKLVRENIKAAQSGDERKQKIAQAALSEHEGTIKEKAKKKTQEFVPKQTKKQHANQIKSSQEARKA